MNPHKNKSPKQKSEKSFFSQLLLFFICHQIYSIFKFGIKQKKVDFVCKERQSSKVKYNKFVLLEIQSQKVLNFNFFVLTLIEFKQNFFNFFTNQLQNEVKGKNKRWFVGVYLMAGPIDLQINDFLLQNNIEQLLMQKKQQKGGRSVVSLKEYDFLTILGEGSFGTVRLVKRKNTNKYSCVKIMKKIELIKSQQVDHISNQYKILSSISHPFVVNFEGLAQNSRHLYMFMEYVPGGQLFTHLRQEGMFEPHKAAFYAAQILLIFQYLHSKNIIYRDLKPENILIGADGYLKLTDFGFAKSIENRTFTLCGTPEYLAPQILQNQGHGKPVDWWTLGVLIYEMIAGIDPFADDDPLVIYQNILKGKLHFPKGFDNDAKSLVKHLLVNDLSKRYGNLKNGVNDIKNHRYINTTNLSNLLAKKISPPYRPVVKSASDTSNFSSYPQNEAEGAQIKPSQDPFLKWD